MTIEIHITAASATDAYDQMEALLRGAGDSQILTVAERAAFAGDSLKILQQKAADDMSPLPGPAPGPRKRGRKPKAKANPEAKSSTPAAGASAPKTAAQDGADAQPAVASNTGTDEKGSKSPAPETSSQDGESTSTAAGEVGNGADAPVVSSLDDFKKRAQGVYAKLADKLNDGNAANQKIADVINAAGYAKLKDVKPEHFTELCAKFDELLA